MATLPHHYFEMSSPPLRHTPVRTWGGGSYQRREPRDPQYMATNYNFDGRECSQRVDEVEFEHSEQGREEHYRAPLYDSLTVNAPCPRHLAEIEAELEIAMNDFFQRQQEIDDRAQHDRSNATTARGADGVSMLPPPPQTPPRRQIPVAAAVNPPQTVESGHQLSYPPSRTGSSFSPLQQDIFPCATMAHGAQKGPQLLTPSRSTGSIPDSTTEELTPPSGVEYGPLPQTSSQAGQYRPRNYQQLSTPSPNAERGFLRRSEGISPAGTGPHRAADSPHPLAPSSSAGKNTLSRIRPGTNRVQKFPPSDQSLSSRGDGMHRLFQDQVPYDLLPELLTPSPNTSDAFHVPHVPTIQQPNIPVSQAQPIPHQQTTSFASHVQQPYVQNPQAQQMHHLLNASAMPRVQQSNRWNPQAQQMHHHQNAAAIPQLPTQQPNMQNPQAQWMHHLQNAAALHQMPTQQPNMQSPQAQWMHHLQNAAAMPQMPTQQPNMQSPQAQWMHHLQNAAAIPQLPTQQPNMQNLQAQQMQHPLNASAMPQVQQSDMWNPQAQYMPHHHNTLSMPQGPTQQASSQITQAQTIAQVPIQQLSSSNIQAQGTWNYRNAPGEELISDSRFPFPMTRSLRASFQTERTKLLNRQQAGGDKAALHWGLSEPYMQDARWRQLCARHEREKVSMCDSQNAHLQNWYQSQHQAR